MEKTWKFCSRGHTFQKSSDCHACPICWSGNVRKKIVSDLPDSLSAPALRALLNAKIDSLSKLSKHSEAEILKLHGVGPSSIPKLRAALRAKKLLFKKK